MKKKNLIHMIIALGLTLPFAWSQEAFARSQGRQKQSVHKHQRAKVHSRAGHQVRAKHRQIHRHQRQVVQRHRHRHYRPAYVHRQVTYVRPHYHYGFYDPCYDSYHTQGIYWDINISNQGWGIGFNSNW